MDWEASLGYGPDGRPARVSEDKLLQYINLKLAALGFAPVDTGRDGQFLEIAHPLIAAHREQTRRLDDPLCPADRRIQDFLDAYLSPAPRVKLPSISFVLDRHGLARTLSLPPKEDSFTSDLISSFRVKQGVLHNPKSDRRTTQGVFHVTEGGFPIPDDKKAVPKAVFGNLLELAFRPPEHMLRLPFTAGQAAPAATFVSLLLRPAVSPEVAGVLPKKSLEIRFFAPGGLVSNLDFVESIFGNAGDPALPENDAGLDVEGWTGHTGCVILAPHLIKATKKSLGLPPVAEATERQKRDGMCWKEPDELYNDGQAFKITARDGRGVMVTVIADNYFGYCKKEVKTQISFSANLAGLCEEEHAGGAVCFPSYDLGEEFHPDEGYFLRNRPTFAEVTSFYGALMDVKSEGYAVDKMHPDVIYVPEDARFDMGQRKVMWTKDGKEKRIKLLASCTYVLPSGYKIRMKKQTGGDSWHLFGTVAEGTLCHKPSTVSGGGKSEISKSITDAMIQGPVFTADFQKEMDAVDALMNRDYGDRFKEKRPNPRPSRPILSPERSLGSVIKLLTPSKEYTDDYNTWLNYIPNHIKEIVYAIKRYYRPSWGADWRDRFSVDAINGHPGHELKYRDKKIVANYLRVGREKDGSWRIFKVRQDFSPAEKLQVEDDITASVVVPAEWLGPLNGDYMHPSVKMVANCEYRLFQRPDDAIHRGYDKQAEIDIASPGAFLSNFEPLDRDQVREIIEDAPGFELYTEPVKELLQSFLAEERPSYVVSSAHPRLVGGKPTKNPRYLQNRPDILNPKGRYLAELGARFARRIRLDRPVHFPVNAVLSGRRNNPPDKKIGLPPLAVYNPIHYQELPELFMDLICSLTGKSPSTTGFGSEGALTKGPFNALWPIVDLNNALVSFIVTGYDGFTTAAGHIGPNIQIDHDISLLVPEIWCRMSVEERDPRYLIQNGFLEKLEDFDYKGRRVTASVLGYRVTEKFALAFLGRVFNNPNVVLPEHMLKPEKQSMDVFIAGLDSIAEGQKRVAQHYFADGSVEAACPPLKALLHIMAKGAYEGKGASHPTVRALFARDNVLASDWYKERLRVQQTRDVALWRRHVASLAAFIEKPGHEQTASRLGLPERLSRAREKLKRVEDPAYRERLAGTLGADPLRGHAAGNESHQAVVSMPA